MSAEPETERKVSFGFEEVTESEKVARVKGVFRSVASRYDLMNDLMSAGVHRLWKHDAMNRVNPQPGERHLDVAGGTGELARAFLAHDEVEAIGLGARDSLRLEAGLCLYGHDQDTTTTPIEASLTWAVSKSRRAGGARPGGFPGADIVLNQIAQGVSRKRVGILPQGKAPVREGVELFDGNDQVVGKVTSGGFSPTLGRPVSMAYVSAEQAAMDNELVAMVRGKAVPVKVARPGFVEARYFRG